MDAEARQIARIDPAKTGPPAFRHKLSPHFGNREPEPYEQIINRRIQGKNAQTDIG